MQPAAPIVAAIVLKQKRIVEAFRKAGAVGATYAVTPTSIGIPNGLAFRKLREHAVLREVATDLYYLDESAWDALRRTRHRIATIILTVFTIGFVILLLVARNSTR